MNTSIKPLSGLGANYAYSLKKIQEFGSNQTPYIYFDKQVLKNNYQAMAETLKASGIDSQIFFSVKANNHPQVLQSLFDFGSNFDVASLNEIKWVLATGAKPEQITFSTTVKIPSHIAEAYALGVRLFAADSESELEKLSKLAPGSNVFFRIAVSNEGSLWPLINKFGCSQDECVSLVIRAKELGLNPVGVAFHVGSQCLRPQTWVDALTIVKQIFEDANEAGINLHLINMGGGFPARYVNGAPSVSNIFTLVHDYLNKNFNDDLKIMIEPGRSMVADAAVLVAEVVGIAQRASNIWAYVDLSIYSGLLESIEKWQYTIVTDNLDFSQYEKKYILAGPTCDSTDVISFEQMLPELKIGDKVYIFSAGAYTNSYQSYNGIPFPQFNFVE